MIPGLVAFVLLAALPALGADHRAAALPRSAPEAQGIPSPAIKALVSTFQNGWHPTIYLNSVSAPLPYVQAAQKAARTRAH